MSDETKEPVVPQMPASWQRFIRRDLPLALAIIFGTGFWVVLLWWKDAMTKIGDEKDKRIQDQKEVSNGYARFSIELAKRGHSASDIAFNARSAGDSSGGANEKADPE